MHVTVKEQSTHAEVTRPALERKKAPLRSQIKAEELLKILNTEQAQNPRIHIEGPHGPVHVLYEHSQAPVTFQVLKEALRITFNSKDCRKLIAPSVTDAVLFLIQLEKIRQGCDTPSMTFSTPEPKDRTQILFTATPQ